MQRLYSMTKKTTQLSGVWLSCLNIYFFIMLSLGWGHQVAPISKQTGLYPGNICPLQAFMGILNLVCFEWQALLTLLTSLFWWNLHDFFKLNMKPTTLTVGANTYEHCNQNLLDFSFLLLVGKIWFSVFADDAALFHITCTLHTVFPHYCCDSISFYLHKQVSRWSSNSTSHCFISKYYSIVVCNIHQILCSRRIQEATILC